MREIAAYGSGETYTLARVHTPQAADPPRPIYSTLGSRSGPGPRGVRGHDEDIYGIRMRTVCVGPRFAAGRAWGTPPTLAHTHTHTHTCRVSQDPHLLEVGQTLLEALADAAHGNKYPCRCAANPDFVQ